MLLFEPPPTQGDLHFRVFGIPVRIHPFFWVATVLLALNGKGGTPPADFVIWVAVVLVSILVHELGHAMTQRHFGGRPWITLHGFGGLASCNDCDRSPRSQILISLAGPAAGFALALLVVTLMRVGGKVMGWTWGGTEAMVAAGLSEVNWLEFLGGKLYWEPLASPLANTALADILQVNILWGLINLLPIYPLDGGQVMREICTLGNARQGIILSLRISMVAAIAMAAAGLLSIGSLFVALMFGYLAYTSFRALQAYQGHQPSSW